MKLNVSLLAVPLLLCLGACQSIRENHYFKDRAGNPPNYYRLQIKGHAFLTSSRYLSGNFDEEAVNNYFGEIGQPKDAKFGNNTSRQPSTNSIVPIGKENQGKKFVLLLSTNSDAISSAFGNFVESKETQKEIARIINRDKLEELDQLKAEEEVNQKRRAKLLSLAEAYLNSITDSEPKEAINIKLLAYLNATADYFGRTQNFKTVAEAKTWFDENGSNLKNP